MKRVAHDYLEFASGRRFYAYGGMLSLGEGTEACYGYDGGLYEDGAPFTHEERLEIAHYMMELWRAWGNENPT